VISPEQEDLTGEHESPCILAARMANWLGDIGAKDQSISDNVAAISQGSAKCCQLLRIPFNRKRIVTDNLYHDRISEW
jgi:hypothetical protein